MSKNDPIRRALLVLVLTERTREFLQQNDPKALKQAEKALKDAPELQDFLAREAEKPVAKKDFEDRHILRAGRLLLGFSGLHPRLEKEIDQFLDTVDKSSVPEACQDVTFAITG